MQDPLDRITRYILTAICKKLVKQGNHSARIQAYYQIMREAVQKEFTEDNGATICEFLNKLHTKS